MAIEKVRRNGPYAPLSATYYQDDDIAEAGPDAELLWARGLAFSSGRPNRGFMSYRQVEMFIGVGLDRLTERVAGLVAAGLWAPAEGGWICSDTRSRTGRRKLIPKAVRAYVFARDRYRCVRCRATSSLTIDHVTPRSRGGSDEATNLQTLCSSCNSRKGAKV